MARQHEGSKDCLCKAIGESTRAGYKEEVDTQDTYWYVDVLQRSPRPALEINPARLLRLHYLGISTFGDKPNLVGPDHLKELFDHALGIVPEDAVSDTPIFLLATAGMRLLKEQARKELLRQICTYARQNTKFSLPDCNLHIQVIPGETEGLYGWIAANYLLGGFDNPEDHSHGKGHHTYGFLDMGGASAQIAFAPNATEAEKHAEDLQLLRMRTIDGAASEYKVFVTTWLKFGMNEARRRYVEALLEASHAADAGELPDPCMPSGLSRKPDGTVIPTDSKDLDDVPFLIGTGRFKECLRQTYPLLGKDAPCEDTPCLLNGVHVPAIDFDVNHFVGVSEYWHTTHEIFEMAHKDKAYDFNTYQQRVMEFCSQDWETIAAGVKEHKWGKKVDEQSAADMCFKASWLINMLHEGIGIPRVGLEDTKLGDHNGTKAVLDHAKDKGFLDPFQAVDKIKDTEVSWTLGKIVLYAASQVPPGNDSVLPVGFGSNVPGIPPDFQYAGSKHAPVPTDPFDDTTEDVSDHVIDEIDEIQKSLFPTTSRRTPGFLLFLLILFIAIYLLLGRERRSRLWRRFTRGGGGKRRRFFGGKLFGHAAGPSYERVLESGEAANAFELADADSDENEHSDSSDGTRVGRSSGWATPRISKPGFENATGYFDNIVSQGQGLGLSPPPIGVLSGNAMDRSGLVVRTDSRERLAPGPGASGKRSRTGSPRRMGLSPLVTDID